MRLRHGGGTRFESLCKWIDLPPFALHIDDRPVVCLRFLEGFVEPAEVRVAVVGPFAIRVGVMDETEEPGTIPRQPSRSSLS